MKKEEQNKQMQDTSDQELDALLKDFHEQDDLHEKIQQFKKKKAAANIRQETEMYQRPETEIESVQHTSTSALDQLKSIKNEGSLEKTTVISVAEEQPEEQTKELEVESEDTNATVIISEDDMRHLVEEEERKKQQKKNEKQANAKKYNTDNSSLRSVKEDEEKDHRLNKIITYIVIGIISIAILVGIFFAVRAIIGSDAKPTQDQQQESESTTDSEQDSSISDSQIETNHDKEISEINGQIQSYQDEISYYQSLISDENTKLENAKSTLSEAETAYQNAKAKLNSSEFTNAESELARLKAQQESETDESKRAELQTQIDAVNKQIESINSEYQQAGITYESAQREYESLQGTTSANIEDYNSKISDLNNKITDLQNQLAKLQ